MNPADPADKPILADELSARNYVAQWAAKRADEAAIERLDLFAHLLLEENQRQNLISKASEEILWLRHFADSAQLLEHVSRETSDEGPWLDLGTGAGFPGLVIAALCPETPVVLVESRARRVEFLARVVQRMGLSHCRIAGERLEQVEPFAARIISARAFAPLEKLLMLSAPFSTKQTRYLLPKGRSAAHELNSQTRAIRAMFHVKHSLTDRDAGIIVSR